MTQEYFETIQITAATTVLIVIIIFATAIGGLGKVKNK